MRFSRHRLLIYLVVCLLLNALLAPVAFGAVCSNNDFTGCPPRDCPTTFGSTTFAVIPNTSFTVNGVTDTISCIWGIPYDTLTGGSCTSTYLPGGDPNQCLAVYAPTHVVQHPAVIINYHSGGGFAGTWQNWGGSFDPLTIISLQRYLARNNRSGGTQMVMVLPNYRLATSIGVNPHPAGAQDAKMVVNWVLDKLPGLLGIAPITMLHPIGFSWGGNMAWVAGNLPPGFYGHSGTGVSPDATPANGFVGASAYSDMSWTVPNGNSSWENDQSNTKFKNQLNSSVLATAQANDASTHGSPASNIISANIASISRKWFCAYGSMDPTAVPVWAGGGNKVYTEAQYAALSSPLIPGSGDFQSILYTGPPSAHVGDLTSNLKCIPLNDIFEFIMGPHAILFVDVQREMFRKFLGLGLVPQELTHPIAPIRSASFHLNHPVEHINPSPLYFR